MRLAFWTPNPNMLSRHSQRRLARHTERFTLAEQWIVAAIILVATFLTLSRLYSQPNLNNKVDKPLETSPSR